MRHSFALALLPLFLPSLFFGQQNQDPQPKVVYMTKKEYDRGAKNYSLYMNDLKRRVDQGDMDAAVMIGKDWESPAFPDHAGDYMVAFNWYAYAANRGNLGGLFGLVNLIADNKCVPKDTEAVKKLMTFAAQHESKRAKAWLDHQQEQEQEQALKQLTQMTAAMIAAAQKANQSAQTSPQQAPPAQSSQSDTNPAAEEMTGETVNFIMSHVSSWFSSDKPKPAQSNTAKPAPPQKKGQFCHWVTVFNVGTYEYDGKTTELKCEDW
jgi:ribosomal protein L12E/L44/L45/RPP1/RPP2